MWLMMFVPQLGSKNFRYYFVCSAYHGHLTSTIAISPYKFDLPGGVGKAEHVHVVNILVFLLVVSLQ